MYTHYWKRPNKPIPDKKWDRFIADVRKIFDKHAGIICRECDLPNRKPVVNDTEVRFNGRGAGGPETCIIDRDFEKQDWRGSKDDHFAFCKTARKPYDVVVVAVLSCLRHHLGNIFEISSDGGDEAFPPYEELADRYDLESKAAPKKTTRPSKIP